jgi:hypothetical protein
MPIITVLSAAIDMYVRVFHGSVQLWLDEWLQSAGRGGWVGWGVGVLLPVPNIMLYYYCICTTAIIDVMIHSGDHP